VLAIFYRQSSGRMLQINISYVDVAKTPINQLLFKPLGVRLFSEIKARVFHGLAKQKVRAVH